MAFCRLKLLLLMLLGSAALSIASTVPRDNSHAGSSLAQLASRDDHDDNDDDAAEEAEETSPRTFGYAPDGIEEVEAGGGVPASLVLAHGVMGCLAFALVFPTGGIIIRTLRSRLTLWIHAGWQVTGLAMAIATLGTGIYKALDEGYLSGPGLKYHVVVGLVAISGVMLQPVTGWVHHLLFKRVGGRTLWSYAHMFWGIGMVTLGAINGAFGLVLEHRETKYIVVYGVLAGLVWAVWMALSVFSQLARRKRMAAAGAGDAHSSRTAGASQEDTRLREKTDRPQSP